MSLREYKRKRDFARTPEPKGKTPSAAGQAFVVQKHAARNLHYDFRLELGGVLKSWAVPKGPCFDPTVKRLAMHVEDHPIEYGAFEGIIPKGEYGGGTVMLWDNGQWEPIGDPHEGYTTGKLKFTLHGQKLRGAWMLVRTGGKAQPDSKQWLLFKERDGDARPLSAYDVLTKMPLSVATGRDLPDIAEQRDWVWGQKPAGKPKRGTKADAIAYDAAKKLYAGVRLTSPEKILYPEEGITKLDLARYYRTVADWILPHLADRPVTLVRCPDGRHKCFYQKHPGVGTADSVGRFPIEEDGKTEEVLMVGDSAGLISLAQMGVLEVHAWGSRTKTLDQPDRLIFDLDPDPEIPWERVVSAAKHIRDFLKALHLESFVKTTGGKGLHLVVPIEPTHHWEEAKVFCRLVADALVRAAPAHFTANMVKAARHGKIYVDYLRNTRGSTAVAPYSPRARPGAPISTPLTWRELSPRVPSDHYTMRNILKRLQALKRDPWQQLTSMHQSLAKPLAQLRSLLEPVRG